MKTNKSAIITYSGMAVSIILLIFAIVGVGAGALYVQFERNAAQKKIEIAAMERQSREQELARQLDEKVRLAESGSLKREQEKFELFEKVISNAQWVDMKDVGRGKATGKAWLAFYAEKTYLRMRAAGLLESRGSNYYEGWIMKNSKSNEFFLAGNIDLSADGAGIIDLVLDGDKTDFRTIVITNEPNDGNPIPDIHILEGIFSSKLKPDDFKVVLE